MRSVSIRLVVPTGLAVCLLVPPLAGQDESRPAEPEVKLQTRQTTEGETPPTVLPPGTQIPLVLQNTVNTKNAAVGDRLYFETIYPVVLNNRVVIPVGSFVRGSLTHVKRPGRIKGRGELHVRFDELTLPNGYTVDLSASLASAGTVGNEEVDRREGGVKSDTSKTEDVSTVAATGSIGAGLGAAAARGGGKGTAIGGAVGAAAGLAYVLLTRGRELVVSRGTTVEIVLSRPLELDPILTQFDWTGQSTSLPGPTPGQRDRRLLRPRIPF